MKKRVALWLAAFWLLVGWPLWCYADQEEELHLHAHSACLMDGETGRVLYGKEETTPLSMASTTKIMTCIVALEEGCLDDVVITSKDAASQPQIRLGAKEGETFVLQDLLYALMLNSDNDVAVMIAEHIGGSVEAFTEKMNLKAREIGCEDTYFVTPNGLDGKDEYGTHHTTAVDLARMLRYCITESPEKELFLKITQMPAYTFWNQKHDTMYNCKNHNAFLQMMDGALTGKTGFTAEAGYCYVGALSDEGRIFIVSLLACGWPDHREYKWKDTRTLMEYGMERYHYRDVFDKKKLKKIPVEKGGSRKAVSIGYGKNIGDMNFPLLLSQEEEIHVEYELPKLIQAPVKKGKQIGKAQYFLGEDLLKEFPIYALQKVEEKNFEWYVKKLKKKCKIG